LTEDCRVWWVSGIRRKADRQTDIQTDRQTDRGKDYSQWWY